CTVSDADAWLASNLPPILAELGPNGLLILTWDEDDGTAGNHILTGLWGTRVIAGSTYTPLATHYAVTRLISDVLGLPLIGYGALEQPILGIWHSPVPAHE